MSRPRDNSRPTQDGAGPSAFSVYASRFLTGNAARSNPIEGSQVSHLHVHLETILSSAFRPRRFIIPTISCACNICVSVLTKDRSFERSRPRHPHTILSSHHQQHHILIHTLLVDLDHRRPLERLRFQDLVSVHYAISTTNHMSRIANYKPRGVASESVYYSGVRLKYRHSPLLSTSQGSPRGMGRSRGKEERQNRVSRTHMLRHQARAKKSWNRISKKSTLSDDHLSVHLLDQPRGNNQYRIAPRKGG
jgi:hypothetical protein